MPVALTNPHNKMPNSTICQTCGALLFLAVPHETTEDEIVEFAHHSKLPNKDLIQQEKWIHPGEYCPNGCTLILHHYDDREMWEKLETEFEKTHTCQVVIRADTTLPLSLNAYKIYIDGNIARTRTKDVQPANSELVWLSPGNHRIVVRESDVKKTGRLESNTIRFTASECASLYFEVGMKQGSLKLIIFEE